MSELPDRLLGRVWAAPAFWTPGRRTEMERRWTLLQAREREVLRLRCQGLTLAQIGVAIGLSASRVHQLQARAIRRLRFGLAP